MFEHVRRAGHSTDTQELRTITYSGHSSIVADASRCTWGNESQRGASEKH